MKRLIPTQLATLVGTMAPAQTPVLLRAFNNPTPNTDGHFGISVAAFGSDRVPVGASFNDTAATNAGAVYLFNTNGTLLTTFTNPSPVPAPFSRCLSLPLRLLPGRWSGLISRLPSNGVCPETGTPSPLPWMEFGSGRSGAVRRELCRHK